MTTSQHSRVRAFVAASTKLSRAMGRVANALANAARKVGIEITMMEEDADIVVLHVIGYPETVAAIESIKARGKKYAIIQYCIRSTQRPSTLDWWPLWSDSSCVAVWSYYDLQTMLNEDCMAAGTGVLPTLRNFYFAPMGADPLTFKKSAPSGHARPYRLFTSGYVAESECVKEAASATAALGARMFHLGPGFPFFGPNVTQEEGVSDVMLVELYNRSEYVAGLRRCEGFEMPALEGLLCGARPICFDAPHYRQWFGDHAVYIPEGGEQEVTDTLYAVLTNTARPVTEDERAELVKKFDWATIAAGFWRVAVPSARFSVIDRKPCLLWVGDAVCASGFARATHHVLNALSTDYDVTVLGINYYGDPHGYPYPIYPALNPMGQNPELFGVSRIPEIVQRRNSDIVVIQQDPWNFPAYAESLKKAGIRVPIVGFVAVDGKNCDGAALNCLDAAIFWTEFGEKEARLGGFDISRPSAVIPLGVDRAVYFPMPKIAARKLLELPRSLDRAFIVGNVNRNQPRKRLDLTVQYFCEWVREYKHDDAFLFLHVAPTGDVGWNVEKLMRYYGMAKRAILSQPDPGQGMSETQLNSVYNSFDIQVTTTAGEGWGLPTLEGMACGIPQVVPDWAALGEWPGDAVIKVPCTSNTHTPGGINVVGGVPDKVEFIRAMEELKTRLSIISHYAQSAHDRACDPMFEWPRIGERFRTVLNSWLPRLLGGEEVTGETTAALNR